MRTRSLLAGLAQPRTPRGQLLSWVVLSHLLSSDPLLPLPSRLSHPATLTQVSCKVTSDLPGSGTRLALPDTLSSHAFRDHPPVSPLYGCSLCISSAALPTPPHPDPKTSGAPGLGLSVCTWTGDAVQSCDCEHWIPHLSLEPYAGVPTASSMTVGDGLGCRPFKPSTARAEFLILKEQHCALYHLVTLESSPTSESTHFSHLHQTRAVSALVLRGWWALTSSL